MPDLKFLKTRKDPSREANSFEQVSSNDHWMSLVGEGERVPVQWRQKSRRGQGVVFVQWGLMLWRGGCRARRTLCSEIQCIMGNGHMRTPREQTDTHEWKHYLPANLLAGGKNEFQFLMYMRRWSWEVIWPFLPKINKDPKSHNDLSCPWLCFYLNLNWDLNVRINTIINRLVSLIEVRCKGQK